MVTNHDKFEALSSSDFVISILPTQKEVGEVMMDDSLMQSVREDSVILESSTISPFFVQ